jgi:lysyl-tRNA synthetase class 1
MSNLISKALESNAWPFKEAEGILKRIGNKLPEKGYVLFETGYGPSGLPHIGTFGEVVRTTMVRKAFEYISNMPTRLFCISDDMDGMRKIPDTIPNKDEYKKYLDLPLTAIPDPFGTTESYGHNMNMRLRAFLDHFGFEYEFFSSTECYKKGVFNDALMKVLKHYDAIMDIMLPTLGEERRATYSPFLPICPKTGKVLQVPVIDKDVEQGLIKYKDKDGEVVTVKVIDGHCKLQWKPDFGMRWAAFDVDFEMYGKDHLVNGPIYSRICQAIGGKPPHQMFFELFLDEQGQKISKSKGNGITIDEWLRYAPQESLSLFMYQSPTKAKKLYFDVIPKNVDDYLTAVNDYHKETEDKKRFTNPAYHIHQGNVPKYNIPISYALLLNLVGTSHTQDPNVIWKYIKRFAPSIDRKEGDFLDRMVSCSINYYNDFVKPSQQYRDPSEIERAAILKLKESLSAYNSHQIDELQTLVFSIGKEFQFELKAWFQALYEILFGFKQGPRMGSFIALYGIKETIDLIESRLQ